MNSSLDILDEIINVFWKMDIMMIKILKPFIKNKKIWGRRLIWSSQ